MLLPSPGVGMNANLQHDIAPIKNRLSLDGDWIVSQVRVEGGNRLNESSPIPELPRWKVSDSLSFLEFSESVDGLTYREGILRAPRVGGRSFTCPGGLQVLNRDMISPHNEENWREANTFKEGASLDFGARDGGDPFEHIKQMNVYIYRGGPATQRKWLDWRSFFYKKTKTWLSDFDFLERLINTSAINYRGVGAGRYRTCDGMNCSYHYIRALSQDDGKAILLQQNGDHFIDNVGKTIKLYQLRSRSRVLCNKAGDIVVHFVGLYSTYINDQIHQLLDPECLTCGDNRLVVVSRTILKGRRPEGELVPQW